MRVLLLVGVWALLAIAGVAVGVLLFRRRTRSLHQHAAALGFTFREIARPFRGSRAEALTILEDGAETEVENVLERKTNKFHMLVFDEYIASDTAAVPTTFAAFRVPSGELPVFQIGARDLFERVEEALGKKIVKIDCDSKFSEHFFVQCEDDGLTRSFLTSARLSALCEHAQHFHVETSPDWLLIYRPDVAVDIEGLEKFAAETIAIAEALLSSQPMPLPASA